jgi:hypothetical protein
MGPKHPSQRHRHHAYGKPNENKQQDGKIIFEHLLIKNKGLETGHHMLFASAALILSPIMELLR